MIPKTSDKIYKIVVSTAFGLLGFFLNVHTIIFPVGEYTIAVLLGLIFPLLISLSWGWAYGLLSALAGGCQSMWWLWGPSNGYAVFLIVPPFTLWVVWHGLFAEIRRGRKIPRWWLAPYAVEIPFRLICSINLLTTARWAIAANPPPWRWAAQAATAIPLQLSVFVAVKQAFVAFVLLLLADVILNIRWARLFFRLRHRPDDRDTGHIISIFLLFGCLFWLLDSIFSAFAFTHGRTFIDLLAKDIPNQNLLNRMIFFLFCLASGLVAANILRKQRESEHSLKKARKEAMTREASIRSLIHAIPDLVWLKNTEGVYLYCNSRFESFFGAREETIVGKTDHDFLDHQQADDFAAADKKVMDTGEAMTYPEKIDFAEDGHHELLETTKTPMYDGSGRLTGVLGIGRDITERTHLQNQLAQAQKMESVGRLAGGVAHDFNNMLSIILGNAELVMEDLGENSPFSDHLKEILNAAVRSSDLTRQLLAFARKQAISPEVLDLNAAVEGILSMLKRLIGEDIQLSFDPGKDLWPVRIDPSQVDQILANMCVNARDAIKGGGCIAIRTDNMELDEIYCRGHEGCRPGGHVMMVVSDTGCGISKEAMEYIFEPFYTSKEAGKGTGLGLATVYGILKQNDGFINVYSEPGQGTVFRIYLPRHEARPLEKMPQVTIKSEKKAFETVLLVEDETAILKITKTMLEQLGYRVLAASTPDRALEIFNSSINENIRLILTDVIMPKMSGKDLAEILTAKSPDLKCLFMSGYTDDVIAHHGILDEGLHFINKPFSKQTLAAKLRDILD